MRDRRGRGQHNAEYVVRRVEEHHQHVHVVEGIAKHHEHAQAVRRIVDYHHHAQDWTGGARSAGQALDGSLEHDGGMAVMEQPWNQALDGSAGHGGMAIMEAGSGTM